jgi:transposase-like protein
MFIKKPVANRCPDCGTVVGKDGNKWSGRKKVQKWLCSACGKVTTHPVVSRTISIAPTVGITVPASAFCKFCSGSMMKAGFGWSGAKKVQRYRCSKCGRVTTRQKCDNASATVSHPVSIKPSGMADDKE